MSTESRTGLETLVARIGGGDSPSGFDRTSGIVIVAARQGNVVLEAPAGRAHANAYGAMHGGWVAGLLDVASGASVQSVLARGEAYTTLSLQVNYLRTVAPHGTVRIEGRVLRAGRRVVSAEASLFEGERLCATASATCLRLTVTEA